MQSELPGDDVHVSGSWALARSGGDPPEVIIDFDGTDDTRVLPMVESYGCAVRGRRSHSLYFRRHGGGDAAQRERWKNELAQFVAGL